MGMLSSSNHCVYDLIWPSQDRVRTRIPLEFKRHFPHTRVTIDCTLTVDQPSNKTEQYQTYSSYKSHNTFKCLVAVSLYGAFTFVSDLWSGHISDKFVTENCGILHLI